MTTEVHADRPDVILRELRLIGRPRAMVGGREIDLPEKAYCLIAGLVLAPRQALDRDVLRHLFWENASPVRRAGNLRQLLLRLHDMTADATLVDSTSREVRLAASGWTIDLEQLRGAVRRAPVPVSLLTGEDDLLEGVGSPSVNFEEWLREHRNTVADLREAANRAALRGDHLDFRAEDRLVMAQRVLASDPFDEAAYRALMRAHVDLDQIHLARRAFLDCIKMVTGDGHGGPEPATTILARDLGLAGSGATGQTAAPASLPQTVPAAASSGGPSQLPPPPTDPIGIPRLVILPAQPLFSDPVFDRIGLGLLEDVTVGLSQYRGFRVIAAHTSLGLAARSVDVTKPAGLPTDLQFDYTVLVSVRGSGSALAASCRLTRNVDHEVLWAIELPLSMPTLQESFDSLVRRIVSTLAEMVEESEVRQPLQAAEPTAYRLYLEGKKAIASTDLQNLRQAKKWFRAATRRSDSFAPAFAGLSRSLTMEWLVRGMRDDELLNDSLDFARKAQRLDPSSGRGFRELGFASLYKKRHTDSVEFFHEARIRNPHDADLLIDFADSLSHDGRPEEALESALLAFKLNPLPPDFYYWILGGIYFQMDRHLEAIEAMKPVEKNPVTSRLLAASHAMAGNTKEARYFVTIVKEHYPNFKAEDVWHIVPDRLRSDTEKLVKALKIAGLD